MYSTWVRVALCNRQNIKSKDSIGCQSKSKAKKYQAARAVFEISGCPDNQKSCRTTTKAYCYPTDNHQKGEKKGGFYI